MPYVCVCFALTSQRLDALIAEIDARKPSDIRHALHPGKNPCLYGGCSKIFRQRIESHRQSRVIPIKPAA